MLTRRAFLHRLGSVVLIGGIAGLSACSGESQSPPTMLAGTTPTGNPQDRFRGRTMTFASWGGAYQDAQKKAFTDPFSAKYGVTVLHDGPVNNTKTRAMAESGNPTWDVVDVTDTFLYNAAKDVLFEPIDYTVVNRSLLAPEYIHEFGVGTIVWSYNIGYNTEVFPGDSHPKSWADIFDANKFPGKRTLPGSSPVPNLEIALLADGVDPKDLYPLDVDRAFAKLDTIKEHVIWWETNSQSQQLFVDGEVTCGLIINGRAYDIAKKGAPIGLEWNQNIRSVDYFVVLKGSKNKDVAMEFINFASQAEQQAIMANEIAYAPTNPEAFKFINPEVRPWLSTEPENAAKGFLINAAYWADHLKELQARWDEWKLS